MKHNTEHTGLSAGLYFKHIMILLAGYLAGLLAAYYFVLIPFDFSDDLRKAKELGIMSVSILSNYPKGKDFMTYGALLAFPLLCSIVPWYLWARRHKERLGEMFVYNGVEVKESKKPLMLFFAMIVFYFFMTFDVTRLHFPAYNQFVGAWPFLGEDGENLAWVQSILSGGVYGKDFYCLYGPMMIYPLSWSMKIFGTTVVVERGLRYFYDLIAFGLIIFFFFKTMRLRTTFVISVALYIFVYYPSSLSINFTYLRYFLGIIPFLMLYLYIKERKKYLLFLAGIIIGQSLLFSQEAGLVSLLVCMTIFFLLAVEHRQWKSSFTDCSFMLSGFCISILPMMAFLIAKGSFGAFLDSLYGFPKIKMLGFGMMPFPAFKDFISDPLKNGPSQYWMLLFYGIMAIQLTAALLIPHNKKKFYLKVSLLLFGIILFRIPIGRAYTEEAWKVFHPGLLLLLLHLDTSITTISKNRHRCVKLGSLLLSLILIVSFCIFNFSRLSGKFNGISTSLERFQSKFTLEKSGYDLPHIERGGIYYDRLTAQSMSVIKQFIDTNAPNENDIYFFPNEAAYYFIFNKQNPTRYAIAYFAVTTEQQLELISDLEKNKPKYIVYSTKTWRVDSIAEDIQIPTVFEYIKQKYYVVDRSQKQYGVLFLQRRPGL